MKLSDEDVDTLTSYADGEARIRQKYGASKDRLREWGLDAGIEKCPGCHWWAESGEMLAPDTDEADGKCCNCRINNA